MSKSETEKIPNNEKRKSISEQNVKISFSEKLAYGFGDAATGFAGVMVTSFALFYFTDVVGVAAGLLGTILMLSRIFDAITNLIMGYLIDLTDTKYGKTRPWIVIAMIPLALSLVLLFSVPGDWSQRNQVIFIIVAYNIYFLMYTISNVPYGTLGTLITRNQQERSNLNIFRMLGYFIVMLLVSNITVPLVNYFGGDARAWRIVAAIYGVIMVAMFTYTFLGTKERVESTTDNEEEKVPLKQAIKQIVTNKYWLIIFFTMIAGWTMLDVLMGINVYYAEYILRNSTLVGPMSLTLTVALIFGLVTVSFFNKQIGRLNTIFLGMATLIVGSLIVLFNNTNIALIMVANALRGFGFSTIMGNAYAMLADTIDYGEWKNGQRVEGLAYSGGTFSTTIGHGLGSAGIGWILGFGGYVSGGDITVQPDSVFTVINFLFIFLPVILAVIVIIMLRFYKLDDEYADIMKDLAERE